MTIRCDGVFAALWTPTDEAGRLLKRELADILGVIRRGGAHGIMALGSTGEFPHLDVSVRKELLEGAVKDGGGLPVLANISDIRPAVAVELGRHAKLLGCSSVVLLPPYFYHLSQADLIEFFVRTAEAVGLPLWLYNFPERVGNRIALETVAAVAERVPLLGIKQSGSEFGYHADLVKLGAEKNFVVFTGADTNLAAAMAMGVKGCVSGLSNVVPEIVAPLFESVVSGNGVRAQQLTESMNDLAKVIGKLSFPLDVAASMEARGMPVGHPKAVVSQETKEIYRQVVGEVRSLLAKWNLI